MVKELKNAVFHLCKHAQKQRQSRENHKAILFSYFHFLKIHFPKLAFEIIQFICIKKHYRNAILKIPENYIYILKLTLRTHCERLHCFRIVFDYNA